MSKPKSKNLSAAEIILKSMPEFAYVFDRDERLVMWNDSLEKRLGYTPEELLGKHTLEFTPKEVEAENIKAINEVFINHKDQILPQHILTKSGKRIPVIDSAKFAVIEGKEYLIGMAIDISELRETEKKLLQKVKELNQLKRKLKAENIYLREVTQNPYDFKDFLGNSHILLNTLYKVKQVSKTNTPVLISGESGTKKEFFARTIHKSSDRSDKPFVKIVCSELNSDNFDTELIGHINKMKKTNGDRWLTGKLNIANEGTLYLENIDDIPYELQSKLLSVLQVKTLSEGKYNKPVKLDLRIIASSALDLKKLVDKKLFSSNLYYFLNTFPIDVPPLRERASDIPTIVNFYLNKFNNKYDKQIKKIPKKAMDTLVNYSWPGNIRELENVIERSVILTNTSLLKLGTLIENEASDGKRILPLMEFERQYIIRILKKTYWRVAGKDGAANLLGLHPETLRSKMRKMNIKRP